MSREATIEGMSLVWKSCYPETKGNMLSRYPEQDLADMFKLLGMDKKHVPGAMELVKLVRAK